MHHLKEIKGYRAASVMATLAIALGLLSVGSGSARAAWQKTGCFAGTGNDPCARVAEEKFGEEVQLGGTAGLAVNRTGAGGVPAGTVYAARFANAEAAIAMYFPKANGGLEFEETWIVTQAEGPYERCGPFLGTEEVGGKVVAQHPCPAVSKAGPRAVGVAVNQTTGDVYALNGEATPPKSVVAVYMPDGAAVIDRFGELAPEGSLVSETPEKVHSSIFNSGIAVDSSGTVYLFDGVFSVSYGRLMVFKPTVPGVFSEYKYVGEVLAQPDGFPTIPVLDDAGDLYVVSERRIEEYSPQTPAAYPGPKATPICSFEFVKGEILSMTVNPVSGEVFFFSSKPPRAVRRLGSCEPSTGKFSESGPEPLFPEAFPLSPERGDLYSLTFDPGRALSASRPPGALYGAAGSPVPEGGSGPGEPGQSALGYIFGHPAEIPPEVESASVNHITESTANLHAVVNAKGFATNFRFQYLTVAEYEANPVEDRFANAAETPANGGNIQGAAGPTAVGANISMLQADTGYRFRIIVSSHCAAGEPQKVCEDMGDVIPFHTYPFGQGGLADGRSWELVSPAQKHGGQVYPADPRNSSCGGEECKPGVNGGRYPMRAAPDGEAVAYEGSPFGEEGGARANAYVAHRSAQGWRTSNPTPSLLLGKSGEGYLDYSTDLTRSVISQSRPALTAAAPAELRNLYLQDTTEPRALAPLFTVQPSERTSTGADELKIRYAGASSDLSAVFFEANAALTAEVAGTAPSAPSLAATEFALYEWRPSTGQIALVNVAPGNGLVVSGATFVGAGSADGISPDGTRAFFESPAGQVFVRINANQTLALSDPGSFLSASADGTEAVLSDGCLYSIAEATCRDLTAGAGGFVGVVGQSETLSHIYFVDTAVVPGSGENHASQSAQIGKNNLYSWIEGDIQFIATLDPGDGGSHKGFEEIADWEPTPANRTAEASPSGRYVTFMSRASLTGYNNRGPCGPKVGSEFAQGPCREVFIYDSQTGILRCPSCNPSEAAPLGWSVVPRIYGPTTLQQARYLLDNGRLYFDSQDSLLPADTNEGVEDVYQWEPNGPDAGSCQEIDGCLSLISAGKGAADSDFLAADETGKNLFFTTRDRLVKQDGDELLDLYDAREGGGFSEASPPGECIGESCQSSVKGPGQLNSGTSSFQGGGNVSQGRTSCKKGEVKRKGRCVKKARRKRSHKGKHPHGKPSSKNKGKASRKGNGAER